MSSQSQSLEELKQIRHMMDKSSRFISLSGLSGVAAGIIALVAAWVAHGHIQAGVQSKSSLRKADYMNGQEEIERGLVDYFGNSLFQLALFTLAAALIAAFFFTWLRSRRGGAKLWQRGTRNMLWALSIPLVAGGFYLLRLMEAGAYGLIAPGCLIFYGIGLISASRYTLSEIKWLGYGQVITGLVNLLFPGFGVYFWAFGFGVLHIFYGLLMWWKYERTGNTYS